MTSKQIAALPFVAALVVAAVVSCGQRGVFAKAESMYDAGHYGEAIQALEPVAAGSGEWAERAQLYLGFSHFKMGRHEQAIRSFEALPERFPESEWADDAWYWAGRCYEDWGKSREAIAAYERAFETIPPSGKANMALRAREAIDMLEVASSEASADTFALPAPVEHE